MRYFVFKFSNNLIYVHLSKIYSIDHYYISKLTKYSNVPVVHVNDGKTYNLPSYFITM